MSLSVWPKTGSTLWQGHLARFKLYIRRQSKPLDLNINRSQDAGVQTYFEMTQRNLDVCIFHLLCNQPPLIWAILSPPHNDCGLNSTIGVAANLTSYHLTSPQFMSCHYVMTFKCIYIDLIWKHWIYWLILHFMYIFILFNAWNDITYTWNDLKRDTFKKKK